MKPSFIIGIISMVFKFISHCMFVGCNKCNDSKIKKQFTDEADDTVIFGSSFLGICQCKGYIEHQKPALAETPFNTIYYFQLRIYAQ